MLISVNMSNFKMPRFSVITVKLLAPVFIFYELTGFCKLFLIIRHRFFKIKKYIPPNKAGLKFSWLEKPAHQR